jgi:hypothetical protein
VSEQYVSSPDIDKKVEVTRYDGDRWIVVDKNDSTVTLDRRMDDGALESVTISREEHDSLRPERKAVHPTMGVENPVRVSIAEVTSTVDPESGVDARVLSREEISRLRAKNVVGSVAAAVAQDPSERFNNMFGTDESEHAFHPEDAAVRSSMSETDANIIRRGLQDARDEVRKAQQEGNSENSRYWQEQAGKYATELRDAGYSE